MRGDRAVTDYSSVGAGFRILILLLLVAVLVLGGLVWFDYLGIVDAQGLLAPVFTMVRGEKIVVDAEDPLLLDKERMAKQLEALPIRSEELNAWAQELEANQAEVNQMMEQLEERFGDDFMRRFLEVRHALKERYQHVTVQEVLRYFSLAAGEDLSAWYRQLGISVQPSAAISPDQVRSLLAAYRKRVQN